MEFDFGWNQTRHPAAQTIPPAEFIMVAVRDSLSFSVIRGSFVLYLALVLTVFDGILATYSTEILI
jgi:hypothetical protein